MISVRESFGAKLLSALLGTVGLLLIVTFTVVRTVTARQVDLVTARTTQNAGTLFEERNELQQRVVARIAGPFTEGRRALIALREAIANNDVEQLAGQVEYEMQLNDLDDALVVFTDDEGVPVLSMLGGGRYDGGDPAGVQPIAEQLLLGDTLLELRGYRVVDGVMYNVRSIYMELAARPIGVIVFGMPVEARDIQAIGSVGGFEACLEAGGTCVVETEGVAASTDLRTAMLSAVDRGTPLRVSTGGARWSIQSEPLVPDQSSAGHRVVAVPLDPVLAPYASIQRALFFGGLGALLLAALVAGMLSRSLTRPVRILVDASRRVAEGDYETVVEVDSRDEMKTLADAFNAMTRGLLTREQYRSVLNKVVSPDIAAELMKGDVELGGENRELSVLFADIRGFTPLTEGMEPQQVIALLNDCMERLSNAVDMEGGVVDKFIGDELMAVFGAPVGQPDHALRAVSAAVRMREAIGEMNHARSVRGERPIQVGIGVATGVAVAGNMGSTDRMNYTVLGDIVNLAARLTSSAGPGEILVSSATRAAAGHACVAQALGGRSLKGFASEIEVFAVESIDRSVTRNAETAVHRAIGSGAGASHRTAVGAGLGVRAKRGAEKAVVVLIACALTAAASPHPASAQWPTLADAGIGFISGGGTFQMDLSGQLDLEGFYFSHDENAPSGLAFGSNGLFAPRVRLFLDTFLGDHLYALVEWRGDRGEAPTADFWEARVEQAYVRLATAGGSLSVQGGIFASPFGSYTQRHLSVVDPFIRPPLPYDHRTVISRRWSPASEDWFLGWKDNPEEWRVDGAPPVWGVPYQWGAMGTATVGFLSVRVAAMNSAPSSEPLDWYEFETIDDEFSWVMGVQARLTPELTLGASYNTGPYAGADIPNASETRPACCPNYDQDLWSADAMFARGPVMLRAEFIHDSWDVPNIDDAAIDIGYTFEAQVDIATGWSTALRYGRIDFRDLAGFGDWDWDVDRWEAALGYRITHNAGVMATFGRSTSEGLAGGSDRLAALRLWWGF